MVNIFPYLVSGREAQCQDADERTVIVRLRGETAYVSFWVPILQYSAAYVLYLQYVLYTVAIYVLYHIQEENDGS